MSHIKTTFAFPGWSVNDNSNKLLFKKVTKWGDNSYKKYEGAWKGTSNLTLNASDIPDTSRIVNFSSSWSQCSSFNSFPVINTLSGETFSFAWEGCTGLTSFPKLNTQNAKVVVGAWANCTQLKTFPLLELQNCKDFSYAWYNCTSLTDLPRLSTHSGTNFHKFVEGCINLSSAPLQGTKDHHSFANCALQRPALIEIFKGLANVIPSPKTIDITNNPGLSDLQYEDYYIAWWKGWAVVPFVCNEISLEDNDCIDLEVCQDGIISVLEKEDKIRTPIEFLCLDNSPGNIPTPQPPLPTPTPTSTLGPTPTSTLTPTPTPTNTATPPVITLNVNQQTSFAISHPSSLIQSTIPIILNPNQQNSFALSHPPPLLPAIVPAILSINPLNQNSFALSNPTPAPITNPALLNLNPTQQISFALSHPSGFVPASPITPNIITLNLLNQNSLSLSHPSILPESPGLVNLNPNNQNSLSLSHPSKEIASSLLQPLLNFDASKYSVSLSIPAFTSNQSSNITTLGSTENKTSSILLSHPD